MHAARPWVNFPTPKRKIKKSFHSLHAVISPLSLPVFLSEIK
jgi:hypothetical protein